jgi:hypothetical protein
MAETWLTVAAAARAIGEHRNQVARMLKAGKIPRRLIGPGSPPKLRLEGLAQAVAGGKRHRIDSRPGTPLPPEPPPDPATQAQQQLTRVAAQVEQVVTREGDWLDCYGTFRQWVSADMPLDLLRDLPDPVPVGDVLVRARGLMLAKLGELDRCEINSRFPR